MLLTLLTAIIVVAIVGFVLWVVTTYIPMPEPFKRGIVVVVVLILLLLLIRWVVLTSPLLRGL